MKQAIAIVDLGGNSRIAILDLQGNILSYWQKKSEYFPDPEYPGGVSFDPRKWQEDIFGAMKKVLVEAGDVELVAVTSSSQREGIVLIGHDGEPVAGYPNSDFRGIEFAAQIDWKTVMELSTLPVKPIYSAIKIYGMMQRHPEVIEKTKYICSISDWVGYLLTGKVVWEKTQAMHSAVYNIYEDAWSEKLCQVFQVPPQILPPLADSGEILGAVTEEASRRTGIPAGTKFIVGGADTQLAIAGVGAKKGDIIPINGTTTPIMTIVDEIKTGNVWMSPTVTGENYLLEINTGITGTNVDTLCKTMAAGADWKEGFDHAEQMFASGKLPTCTAVFSYNLFSGEDFLKYGSFVLNNPLTGMTDWKDMLYAMIMNVAFVIKVGLDIIKPHVKEEGRLVGIGGGFSGSVAAQTLADITGQDVYIMETSRQATIYGCYNVCCCTLGLPEMEQKIKHVYKARKSPDIEKYYEKWSAIKKGLLPINQNF